MPQKVQFRLTDADPNITKDAVFGTAVWRDTWKFRCPQHMQIVLQPGDLFSAYINDSADAEFAAPDALVKIEIRDPSEESIQLIYGPNNYLANNNFQDIKQLRPLQIEHPVVVKPRDWIVVATKDDLGLDAASIAASYFQLLTTKVIE